MSSDILIGTEIHTMSRRFYLLQQWKTLGGFEVRVLRLSQKPEPGDVEVGAELLTTYCGPILQTLLRQAKSDVDYEIWK
jgi:hypothetical protein